MEYFVLLIFLLVPASAQLSGSGYVVDDTEVDNDTYICFSPYSSSNDTTTAISFASIDEASLYGQCLSVCLDELLLLNESAVACKIQNLFKLEGFYLFSDIDNDCPMLSKQVSLCAKGCFIKERVNFTDNCTDNCLSICETEYENDSICNDTLCSIGCQLRSNSSINEDPVTFPVFPNVSLHKTSSMGIYDINITEPPMEGSAMPFQNHSVFTLIIKLVTQSYDEGISTTFFNKIGLIRQINLTNYICQNVLISFSWINQQGQLFEVSSPISINITGVSITQPLPVSLSSIKRYSSYDHRRGYFGHYQVNISWTNPPDVASISHYEIHLEHGQYLNRCKKAVYENIKPFDDERTIYIMKASTPNEPPFANCQYDLKIVTVPIDDNIFHSVNTSTYITFSHYDPNPETNVTCSSFLNANYQFTIVLHFVMSQYLAFENVIEQLSVIPESIQLRPDGTIDDTDAGRVIELPVKHNKTHLLYNISQDFWPRPTANYEYKLSITIDWLYGPNKYRPLVQVDSCKINGLSPQPDTMDQMMLTQPVRREQYRLFLYIEWKPPASMNGKFSSYEIYMTSRVVSPNEAPGQVQYLRTINNASKTDYYWQPLIDPQPDEHCYYLYIRASNDIRAGNWSIPIVIAIDSNCTDATENYFMMTTTSVESSSSGSILMTTSSTITSSSQTTSLSKSITISELTTAVPSVSATLTTPLESTTPFTASSTATTLSLSITAVILVLLTICIVFTCFLLHCQLRRRKRRLEMIQEGVFNDPIFDRMGPRLMTVVTNQPICYDLWEIPPSQVIIECELGQGEFGDVYRGVVTDPIVNPRVRALIKESHMVAVKLLKTSASGSERSDFLQEIDLMKKISEGNNPHVVNMIGCVTSQEPLCLITEFVKYGDLLSYLRSNRKMVTEGDKESNPYPDLEQLQSIDLISFAYQIASGMEFLSSLHIVHRDLACRNVLITEAKTLKITDFGMSRMVESNAYVKTTKGRLPLKWMAIESITDREFTTYSDVWSYGVTLWEIGTLGGFPYPTVSNDELLVRLKQGYRMECPENISKEIYEIMLECWQEVPIKRPSFTALRDKFDQLLSARHCNAYIDLRTDEMNDIYNAQEDEPEVEPESPLHAIDKRSNSPSQGSLSSSVVISESVSLRVTNPWVLQERQSVSPSFQRRSFANFSPHLSPQIGLPRPQRPTSLSLWERDYKENCYVDEPAGIPTILIKVSSSSPSSPTHV